MIPANEYAPFYRHYIQLIEENQKSIIENLIDSQKEFDDFLRDISVEKQNYAYAEGKWTIKEIIQHVIDTERVFCYRALCFARKDTTPLPGFDQDIFANNVNLTDKNYEDLLEELAVLRKGTILLFKSFSDEALLQIGTASGSKMSVRALGFLFSGHQKHHFNIIKERYF